MTPTQFVKEMKSPARRPRYVVSGGEPSAVAQCLAAALEAVDEGFRDFNHQVLELEAGQAGRLRGEAGTMPFFASPRVIVVKNPPFSGDDWNSLADYLEDPNPETTIVMVIDKPDARLRFFKKAKNAGAEVEAKAPKGAALNKWLEERFAERGVNASPQAARLIIERAGTELPALLGEAEKLSLYLGEGGRVTPELVRELVSLAPSANVFELGEAMGRRDAKTALAVLLELLATEHHLPVLAMMVRHFRIMLQIKTRQASLGRSRLGSDQASELGLHPFVLEKTQGQAAAWSWTELTRALAALEEAHRSLVTTATDPQAVLENLALNLSR
ncbi:DNA polymerase III subunit delta [Deltaproteobacteria bacterium OttesenSCG-928-M10]|nr:DNA polymerase III subunit delta [Deltaproteobacteria bacterium OttesenSCG-928-M10]